MSRDRPTKKPLPLCKHCRAELHPGRGDHYLVAIISVADPAPPEITEQDLARDVGAEIRKLIRQIGDRSERSLVEEVYHRVAFRLCLACHARWSANPTNGPAISKRSVP